MTENLPFGYVLLLPQSVQKSNQQCDFLLTKEHFVFSSSSIYRKVCVERGKLDKIKK